MQFFEYSKAMMKSTYQILANRIKLLAHPERLRILDVLRRETECVCHLEAFLDKPQPYVSQQLRVLREAGIIQDEKRGQNVYYRLVDAEIAVWLDQLLGPIQGEHPDLAYHKQVISCEPGVKIKREDTLTKKVLVLCTGNSCRSQMAEGLINARLGPEFQAVSAGTQPSGYVHPKAIQVMAEWDIDLSRNRSKNLDQFRGQYFDYVLTVCDSAKENCPVWLGAAGRREHIGFDDPADATGTDEEITAEFRRVRDEIAGRVLSFLQTAQE